VSQSSAPPDHPLAAILSAVAEIRTIVEPIPGAVKRLDHRLAKVEERQEQQDQKIERSLTIASGASRRVSELESQHQDITKAMVSHVSNMTHASRALEKTGAALTSTSEALVQSNQAQNVELDKQTSMLHAIKKWTPVIVAIAALLGTALGTAVSAYVHAKTLESLVQHGSHP